MAKSKAPIRGRTPVYDPEYHPRMGEKYALLGFTDQEIAESFRVDLTTFYAWMQQYDDFSQSVTRGKAPADAEVVASFFKRATGYDQPSEKIFCYEGEVIRAETLTHYPPDPGAALNWLKNRQPDKWRDKRSLELEDGEGEPVAWPIVRLYTPPPEGEDKA